MSAVASPTTVRQNVDATLVDKTTPAVARTETKPAVTADALTTARTPERVGVVPTTPGPTLAQPGTTRALDATEVGRRVDGLVRAFADGNQDAVKTTLHGVGRADREAIRDAFNADARNRGFLRSFEAQTRRLGLANEPDFQSIMGSATGRNDDVARLRRAFSGDNSVDRETVLSVYRGRSRAEVDALDRAYRTEHGTDIGTELTRRFGRNGATELALARLGSDVRKPEHELAARLAATTEGLTNSGARAQVLGDVLESGTLDAVRRAYGELRPGRGLDADMRLGLSATSPNIPGRADLARINAALAGDRVGYVAETALGLARGGIAIADARRALGMVNGRDVSWTAVEARANAQVSANVTDAVRWRLSGDQEAAALFNRVTQPGFQSTTTNQVTAPDVRAAAVDASLNDGWFHRRTTFTDAVQNIPLDQRAALNASYRARTGRSVEDTIRARYSGVERERALADWRGNVSATEMLYCASRDQATGAELGRSIAALTPDQRGRLAADFDAAYPQSRTPNRTPYETAIARLTRADGEAARNLHAQLQVARLRTPEGIADVQASAQRLLSEGRGDYNSISRFMMDKFTWGGPQLDASARELFFSIDKARRDNTLREGQPVPADIRNAYSAFTRDYARYLREQGQVAEVAADVAAFAGATAVGLMTGGLGGVAAAAITGAATRVGVKATLSPAYRDQTGVILTDTGTELAMGLAPMGMLVRTGAAEARFGARVVGRGVLDTPAQAALDAERLAAQNELRAAWGMGPLQRADIPVIPLHPEAIVSPATGRYDAAFTGPRAYNNALAKARLEAGGDLGPGSVTLVDRYVDARTGQTMGTGTIIGERSADGKRGWRIDDGHVNWWDYTAGNKGTGGRFGHAFFPHEQNGPYSLGRDVHLWSTP